MTFCLFVSAQAVAVASSIGNTLIGGKLLELFSVACKMAVLL